LEYRYRDKVYLSSYMLDTDLFNKFGFLVEDAAPVRSVYILNTNEGMKVLKKIDYSKDELMFIYDSLNIIRKQYPYVINFRESVDKKPYVEYGDGVYIVLDIIEGRDCNFENPVDLSEISKALAKFHLAGENISVYYEKRYLNGKMIERLEKRIEDMKKYREIADIHVNRNDFDRLYLEYYSYYMQKAKETLDYFKNSCYRSFCETHHTLCHHDLAYHNILIGNDDNVYFLDFDYSIIDLPCHDISNMIVKAVKHSCWCSNIANSVIQSYMDVRPISKDEMSLLYGYLMFPQDFYDITTAYYMRTRNWDEDEFTEKLIRRAEYKDDRERFLSEFKSKWIDK